MMKNETIDNIRVENDREHETVADIAAVLRRYVLPSLAERLEAAWKREKADAESDALAVGGIVEAARTTEKSSAVGNAAAMREALAKLRQRFANNVAAYQDRYFKFSGWHWHKKASEAARWRDVFCELQEECDAALSAPARNCDMFTRWEAAKETFMAENWQKHFLGIDDAMKWLFALAEEGSPR